MILHRVALKKRPHILCEMPLSDVELLIVGSGKGFTKGAQIVEDIEKDVIADSLILHYYHLLKLIATALTLRFRICYRLNHLSLSHSLH